MSRTESANGRVVSGRFAQQRPRSLCPLVRTACLSTAIALAMIGCSSSETATDPSPVGTGGSVASDAGTGGTPQGTGGTAQTGGSASTPDAATPDVVQSDGGGVGAYGVCKTPTDCETGLKCVTVVDQPEYGQCTKDCAQDSDCPASPTGAAVGCHPEGKICLSLCGVHGGTCPDGLVCTAQEFCLEPSGVTPTKKAGEHCKGSAECLDGAECVEGQNTSAYCAPKCTTDDDCAKAAPGSKGTCANAGTFNFCMFMCGMMANGAKCPGDLICEGNAVCR